VLVWVSHSQRPLSIGELCLALAAEMGSTDLDPENVCLQDTILASSLGLVAVDKTSRVRLIHSTLQEYLCLPGVLPDAHKTPGEPCLAYLNYDQVRELPATEVPGLHDMPFLHYSSLYWGFHAKQGLSDGAKSLAVRLLSLYENHISSALLCAELNFEGYRSLAGPPFTGLHCASYLGIVCVVEDLGKMKGCDINEIDCWGFTQLSWAAQRGNKEVARLLLTRDDVEPERSDNQGQTPLSIASFLGHESVVRLLLARGDVDPNKSDVHGETPLSRACYGGSERVVRLLLARGDVDPNRSDVHGETPLSHACYAGSERVVRLLLARDDVDPNKSDVNGGTPFSHACHGGREGMVRLLLARGNVKPDKPESNGRTPLLLPAERGDEGVVRLLLARDDVDPNGQDREGVTPLWRASFDGHEGVARLLLARGDVNPSTSDNWGRAPLWATYVKNHKEIRALLRARITTTGILD